MIATATEAADPELVAAVRAGSDEAFEVLYRRYHPRIAGFVRGMLRDDARAEDVTQEAFLSALRRMRANDAEINFKPWIYQIARNAAIDSYRRTSHAVEVSMDADDGLRASDRTRLVGLEGGPDNAIIAKERLNHLQGAFDELSDVHTQVLVMRELEGLSYREIGQKLDLTRPAVESALFRARRRLETEYAELSEGRRCDAMRAVMVRMVHGAQRGAEEHRLARHARRCSCCRKRARELGIEPMGALAAVRAKAAALFPLPWLLPSGSQVSAPLAERAAALAAVAALAGAGGVAVSGGMLDGGEGFGDRARDAAPAAASKGPAGGAAGQAAEPRLDGRVKLGDRSPGREREGSVRSLRGGGEGASGGGSGGIPLDSGAAGGSPAGGAPGVGSPRVPDAPSLRAPGAQLPSGEVQLSLPETPKLVPPPAPAVPKVELPPVELPSVDDATGSVPELP